MDAQRQEFENRLSTVKTELEDTPILSIVADTVPRMSGISANLATFVEERLADVERAAEEERHMMQQHLVADPNVKWSIDCSVFLDAKKCTLNHFETRKEWKRYTDSDCEVCTTCFFCAVTVFWIAAELRLMLMRKPEPPRKSGKK